MSWLDLTGSSARTFWPANPTQRMFSKLGRKPNSQTSWRILVDENIFSEVVEALEAAGHDVEWARVRYPGLDDVSLLSISFSEGRIMLTEDRDFGELAFLRGLPSIGVVLAKVSDLQGSLSERGQKIASIVSELNDRLIGAMTVIEADRIRQRPLR